MLSIARLRHLPTPTVYTHNNTILHTHTDTLQLLSHSHFSQQMLPRIFRDNITHTTQNLNHYYINSTASTDGTLGNMHTNAQD